MSLIQVVKKIASYFIMMEDETEFLSTDMKDKIITHLKIVKIQTDQPLCFDTEVPVSINQTSNTINQECISEIMYSKLDVNIIILLN